MTQGPNPNQLPQSPPPADIRGAIYGTGMLREAEELIANAPDEVMEHAVGNVAAGDQVAVGRWSKATGNRMVPVTVRAFRNNGAPILPDAPPLPPVELPQPNAVLPPQQPTGFGGNRMDFGPRGGGNFPEFGPTGPSAPPSFSSPERQRRQSVPPTGQESYFDSDPEASQGSIFVPLGRPSGTMPSQPADYRPYIPDATPRAVEPEDFDPNQRSLHGPNVWGQAPRSVIRNADNNTGLQRFQRRVEREE